MKQMKIVKRQTCGCEAYPFCEHAPNATPEPNKADYVLVRGGEVLPIGSTVKDFRGEKMTVEGFELPRTEASTGRVVVNGGQAFYPSIIDAKIVLRSSLMQTGHLLVEAATQRKNNWCECTGTTHMFGAPACQFENGGARKQTVCPRCGVKTVLGVVAHENGMVSCSPSAVRSHSQRQARENAATAVDGSLRVVVHGNDYHYILAYAGNAFEENSTSDFEHSARALLGYPSANPQQRVTA